MEFSNPTSILEYIGLGDGETVVDLGSGSGHYSMAACHLVGHEGRVYAVDVQKDLLERLQESARAEGCNQLEIIWGDIEQYGGSKLREGTADVVLLCNILFQVENTRSAVDEAMRVLRSGGRLVVVDWTDSHFGMGPDQNLIVTLNDAQELFSHYSVEQEKEFEAGSQHWGLVFRKQ